MTLQEYVSITDILEGLCPYITAIQLPSLLFFFFLIAHMLLCTSICVCIHACVYMCIPTRMCRLEAFS